MIDTNRYFLIWGIITSVIAIISIVAYFWLSRVARFENRKQEIALGMILCTLSVSCFLFLPLFFSQINLNALVQELSDYIQSSEVEVGNVNLEIIPFISPFMHFIAPIPIKYIKLLLIGIPVLFSILIIIFTIRIIFLIREPKIEQEKKDNRKHLFEYNTEIVTNLNKTK